jgi:pre-rRNA-processing protein TSR1
MNAAIQLRLNRRNHAKQTQLVKRNAIISATRIFNGVDGAPRIVAIIPLSEDVSSKNAVSLLAQALDISAEDCPEVGLWKIRCASPSFTFWHSITKNVEQIVSGRHCNF